MLTKTKTDKMSTVAASAAGAISGSRSGNMMGTSIVGTPIQRALGLGAMGSGVFKNIASVINKKQDPEPETKPAGARTSCQGPRASSSQEPKKRRGGLQNNRKGVKQKRPRFQNHGKIMEQ